MFSRLRDRFRLCARLVRSSASAGPRSRNSSFRPQVDCLETRCLMTSGVQSTFFLTPGSGGGGPVISYAAPDAQSSMWLLDLESGIARLDEQGSLTRFEPKPDTYTTPTSIVDGPDGNAWFTDFVQQQIGRLTPTGILRPLPLRGIWNRLPAVRTATSGSPPSRLQAAQVSAASLPVEKSALLRCPVSPHPGSLRGQTEIYGSRRATTLAALRPKGCLRNSRSLSACAPASQVPLHWQILIESRPGRMAISGSHSPVQTVSDALRQRVQ
jgi:hypothetical protein